MFAVQDLLTVRSVGNAVAVLIVIVLLELLSRLYKHRTSLNGLPQPPHHTFFGQIPVLANATKALPPNTHPHVMMHLVRKQYKLPEIFYMNTWPFGYPICAITSPDVAHQITVQNSLPKHQSIDDSLWPITGVKNLECMNGLEHKRWRAIFNPGFSNVHLMTLASGILDDALTFMEVLGERADSDDMFSLEEAATRATIDIIGRVVLDAPMHAQTSENEFVNAFRNQCSWMMKSPFNPLRAIVIQLNKRKMDRYVTRILNDRFAGRSRQEILKTEKRNRPIIDIALDAYLEEIEGGAKAVEGLNAEFLSIAIDQLKVFMFAGHDTTSSTICYAAYELSRNPECLEKVLQEYNDVLGKDASKTAEAIKDDSRLLNKLPYTVAIIKEVLRLWPPASSVRAGQKDVFLRAEDGTQYPTEGFLVWPIAYAMHRHPSLWKDPDTFNPSRFLVTDPSDPLFPKKGAWRPFEMGSRNCIGQELAMIETKIIMALMLRSFDVRPAYKEFDRSNGGKGKDVARTTPDGERAYQVRIVAAKPADGMPVRVRKR